MTNRCVSILVVASMLFTALLSGCASANTTTEVSTTDATVTTMPETSQITEATTEVTEAAEVTEATDPVVATEPEETLTITQQNSINMLNYLAALLTEINASSSSRVYLEEVYSELINNTDPSVVDTETLREYDQILDILEKYRMVAVKRDRLQYIYEQNSAAALRSAMPNPLSLLNVVQSGGGLKSLVSVLYMTVDSINSYNSHTDQIELQYLQDGWTLDDEAAGSLHTSRKGMFSYMVRIVGDYNLPGNVTLNENSVTEFVRWKNHENNVRRIEFLEAHEATYSWFGDYWLVLASSYYQSGEMQKCLDAVVRYQELDINIFRRDYQFAEVIPYAIIAAKETMDAEDYRKYAKEYVALLLANADQKDWEMQYFAAQTYLELYAEAKEREYLQLAYNTAKNVVNSHLIDEQRKMNADYLSEIKEVDIPDGATKDEKKHIKEYNKHIKAERKIAVPPIYEPLRLCCDLLFGLAEELGISVAEQQEIDTMLHYQGQPLFLDRSLDDRYRFNVEEAIIAANIDVEFDGDNFSIPAQCVSDISVIRMSVAGKTITDWTIKEVDRNKSQELTAFMATFISEEAKDLKFAAGDTVTVEVLAYDGVNEPLTFTFRVEKTSILKVDVLTKFVRE